MKYVGRMLSLLLLAALLCTLMPSAALAAEEDGVWLSVTEDTADGSVTALIVTNTTVTDGVVKLSYDSTELTYQEITVNGDCVAQYAVNPNEAGTVRISWVAPGQYESDGAGIRLLQVTFTGTDGSSLSLSGAVHDGEGSLISLVEVDTSALTAAIAAAEALDQNAYTADSYAAVESALTEAKAVLADPTATQEEVDAAAKKLEDAMDALVAGETEPVTEPSTAPATQPGQGGGNSTTGDESKLTLVIAVMAICAVGIVAVAVIMKKRGRRE